MPEQRVETSRVRNTITDLLASALDAHHPNRTDDQHNSILSVAFRADDRIAATNDCIAELERDNAALTAEVERLRSVLCNAEQCWGDDEGEAATTMLADIRAALTPPADQPAPATRSPLGKPFNPGVVIDNTPRPIQPPKIGEGSLPKPAPATKPLSSVEEVRDALGIPESPVCRHCKGTGRAPSEWLRVPAPEPPPGADARTDDGRFVSGTGYGGERR